MSGTYLQTGDALRISGADPIQWQNSIVRGAWRNAPAVRGNLRYFDTDDVVALCVFSSLASLHVTPSHAARLASDVREMLRDDPTLSHAFIVKVQHPAGSRAEVTKKVTNPDLKLFDLQLAKWRALIEKEMSLQT